MMVMTHRALDQILLEIQAMQSEQGLKRFWTFQKDPEKIAGMRKKYDDALGLFQVGIMTASEYDDVLTLKSSTLR
jgi:hypothetical protein